MSREIIEVLEAHVELEEGECSCGFATCYPAHKAAMLEPVIERLLADEREKVREKYDQELIRLAERLHDIGELEIGKTVESVADGLRDLTKDLAASSREKGQPTAEEVKAVSAAIERKSIGKLIVDEGGEEKGNDN